MLLQKQRFISLIVFLNTSLTLGGICDGHKLTKNTRSVALLKLIGIFTLVVRLTKVRVLTNGAHTHKHSQVIDGLLTHSPVRCGLMSAIQSGKGGEAVELRPFEHNAAVRMCLCRAHRGKGEAINCTQTVWATVAEN